MTSSAEVRDRLIATLRRDLVGPAPEDADLAGERLGDRPSQWYLTGYICPGIDAPEVANPEAPDIEDQLLDEDGGERNRVDATSQDGAAPDRSSDELRSRRRLWRPQTIGITVMVPIDTREVTAIVSWGDYRTEPPIERFLLEAQSDPSTPDQRAAPEVEWVRTPRREQIVVPVPEGGSGRGIIVPNSSLPQLPGGALELVAHARPYAINMPDGSLKQVRVLSVFLVNRRPQPRRRYEDAAFAFQARIELVCASGFAPRGDISGYKAGDWDRRIADLHYADASEYAVGRNTSAEWFEEGGRCTRVATCPLPLAAVERVAPKEQKELPGVEFGMERLAQLADAGAAPLRAALAPLVELYGLWIDQQQRAFGDPATRRRETAHQLIANMQQARGRIEAGIELLATDDNARLAFRFMNDAIAASQRRRSPQSYPAGDPTKLPKWRPFQLAFILVNLAGIYDRTHADREIVDLLFFPTGGGKTEAYLGLAAFTIAQRRILNPGMLGAGVSIIMRYTLRLLTLDQLGRAAGVICALELARQDARNVDKAGRKLLGDWPIEIGLWVGSAASPNRLGGTRDTGDDTAVTRVRQHRRDPARHSAPAPIKTCPWCNTEFTHDSFACVPNEQQPTNLEIRCVNGDCDFSEERPLPIVVVDEPIYRRLPAFIVATIDKFASLPWVGDAGAFFAHVDRFDASGFYGAARQVGGQKLPGGAMLLPPDLVIQDELHLISGPLGTIAGLYEAAIDALASREVLGKLVRPKIVASTATVRRAEQQIRLLFDRSATQIFPPPGLTRHDSFFAVTDREAPPRLYLGVAAQGRGPKLIFLRVLQTMMAAAEAEFTRLPAEERKHVDPYMTALCYFNALKELGGALRIVEDEVRSGLRSYGDGRRRNSPVDSPFANRRMGDVLELTSRKSTDQVAEAKKRLELSFGEGDTPVVDVALATNMISVGLDITRLGLMLVQGQPKAAAEYIQATSRVGRDHNRPGLVITVLNLMKPRDRAHFEHFTQFHRTFYRAVEATSVTPWAARALDRSLAALLVSLVRHLEPRMTPETAAGEIERRREAAQRARDILVQRAMNAPQPPAGGQLQLENAITELVNAWMTVAEAFRGDSLTYSDNHRLLSYPLAPQNQGLSPEHQMFEAARSMRDVEPNVALQLRDPWGKKLSDRN